MYTDYTKMFILLGTLTLLQLARYYIRMKLFIIVSTFI